MTAICIDDEAIILDWLDKTVSKSEDIEKSVKFTDETLALEYTKENHFDIAFIDIELHSIDGISLAEQFRQINPSCGIVFCTGHPDYAIESISRILVNGYLLKPIEYSAVQKEIDKFKLYSKTKEKSIIIDLQNGINITDKDGLRIHFKRSKTEKLIAVLAKQQGRSVSARKLCSILWQDSSADAYIMQKNENYLTQLFTDLRRSLDKYTDGQEILKKDSDGYSLNMKFINLLE